MSVTQTQTSRSSSALENLVNREEVLQICYWYEGEGFGSVFAASTLEPFLRTEPEAIEVAFGDLETRGHLRSTQGGYEFTDAGRKEGGRLFADSFADFQRPAHGECEAGCCDGDDHSQCGDDCPYH